jgi:uncharacterized protein YecE (DUF72 family)
MLAFEFRNASWFGEELFALLHRHNSAFGVVEKEEGDDELETPREVTGPFVYMRLRKEEYESAELADWAGWILDQKVPVYCYLKHDERAPMLANRLLEALKKG